MKLKKKSETSFSTHVTWVLFFVCVWACFFFCFVYVHGPAPHKFFDWTSVTESSHGVKHYFNLITLELQDLCCQKPSTCVTGEESMAPGRHFKEWCVMNKRWNGLGSQLQKLVSTLLQVRSRRSATFTPSAHVRRQYLPVWPPALNKIPLPSPLPFFF